MLTGDVEQIIVCGFELEISIGSSRSGRQRGFAIMKIQLRMKTREGTVVSARN